MLVRIVYFDCSNSCFLIVPIGTKILQNIPTRVINYQQSVKSGVMYG